MRELTGKQEQLTQQIKTSISEQIALLLEIERTVDLIDPNDLEYITDLVKSSDKKAMSQTILSFMNISIKKPREQRMADEPKFVLGQKVVILRSTYYKGWDARVRNRERNFSGSYSYEVQLNDTGDYFSYHESDLMDFKEYMESFKIEKQKAEQKNNEKC